MKYPFVSIISAVRNEEKYIKELLDSLNNLNYPKDKYEIIISDGMSTDNTRKIASKYPNVKVLDNIEKRTAPGRNLAINNAKGKYVAITDGDCKVNQDWLKILVEKAEKTENNVVAVGGPNLIFDSDPAVARVIGYMQESFIGSGGSAQSKKIKKEKEVYSIPNCNILYKKDIILKAGLYDEYFDLGEDGDLNFRLRKRGYKFIFLPSAIVFHHRRESIIKFAKGMFIYGREMAKINKKNKTMARWYSLIPSLFLLFILTSLINFFFIKNNLINIFNLSIYSLYLLILLYAMLDVLKKMKFNLAGILTLILLPIQHISYGFGFLWGLLK